MPVSFGIIQAAGWITLLTSIEAVALSLLRSGGVMKAVIASLIYSLAVVPLLIKTLQYEGVGMVNFLWNIFSTLLMFMIGIYFFGERIAKMQLLGVCVSFVGIAMVLMAPDAL